MDKILAFFALAAIGIGALFLPRIARGSVNTGDGGGEPFTPDPEAEPLGTSPKGIRNNNPMNLEFRTSIQWRGQLGTDGRFAVFDTALNGIRAGMINIHTKFHRDGIRTVRRLINTLSPSFENPTENFVQFVSNRLGVSPEQPLDWRQVIIPLSKAIVFFENGEDPYPDSLYRQALQETGK